MISLLLHCITLDKKTGYYTRPFIHSGQVPDVRERPDRRDGRVDRGPGGRPLLRLHQLVYTHCKCIQKVRNILIPTECLTNTHCSERRMEV